MKPGVLATAHILVVDAFLAQILGVLILLGYCLVLGGGQCHAAYNITFTTTHLDGIGGNYGIVVVAVIVESDNTLVHALGKLERTKINPHTASHRLVNDKLLAAFKAVDSVGGVMGAVGERLVAHVDGKLASLGHINVPRGLSELVLTGLGLYHAVRTFFKWVLEVFILATVVGKALALAVFPFFLSVVLVVTFLGMAAVVVNDSSKVVGVALTGVPHIGAGILKHWHDKGYHVAVGVHVFNGLEHAGALPFPAV